MQELIDKWMRESESWSECVERVLKTGDVGLLNRCQTRVDIYRACAEELKRKLEKHDDEIDDSMEWMKIAQRRADKLVILAEALEDIIDLVGANGSGSECRKIAKEALKKYGDNQMRKTLTQQVILGEIRKAGSITPSRVMEITGCVYRDRMDYVWQTLGRMVKAGMIRRVDKHKFELGEAVR